MWVRKHKDFSLYELKEALRYEPRTGFWFWVKPNPQARMQKPGSRTGKPRRSGECSITFRGFTYRCSTLAWFYMTGNWPKIIVDHKNRNVADNRWTNLRLATLQQNRANSIKFYSNTSGFKGVYRPRNSKRYRASIGRNGKTIYLGSYKTAKAASTAYAKAAKKFYGEFARVR